MDDTALETSEAKYVPVHTYISTIDSTTQAYDIYLNTLVQTSAAWS